MAGRIRELLGLKESIGNLRVSSRALEFDLFAEDKMQLEDRLARLEKNISQAETVKLLDKIPRELSKQEVVREGVELFNQERYWEAHEVLEQAWQPASGVERDTVQGLILAAAGLVHHQKGRDAVALGMLEKALGKLDDQRVYEGVDVAKLRSELREALKEKMPRILKLARVSRSAT